MTASVSEIAQEFEALFQKSYNEIASLTQSANRGKIQFTTSDAEKQQPVALLAKLRKSFSDAVPYLPTYSQRSFENQLNELEKNLESLRRETMSKSKFSFKRKEKVVESSPPKPETSSQSVEEPGLGDNLTDVDAGPAITSLKNTFITPPETSGTSLTISDLSQCILDLIPTGGCTSPVKVWTSLHINNIKDSVLIVGPVQGSVILHSLHHCLVVASCHQFRIHSSSGVHIYLSASSHPIIEHSSDLRFTKYPDHLGRSSHDFGPNVQQPALIDNPSTVTNEHPAVLDFSHIKSTPSPNWMALDEARVLTPEAFLISPLCNVPEILSKLLP